MQHDVVAAVGDHSSHSRVKVRSMVNSIEHKDCTTPSTLSGGSPTMPQMVPVASPADFVGMIASAAARTASRLGADAATVGCCVAEAVDAFANGQLSDAPVAGPTPAHANTEQDCVLEPETKGITKILKRISALTVRMQKVESLNAEIDTRIAYRTQLGENASDTVRAGEGGLREKLESDIADCIACCKSLCAEESGHREKL